jgi:hypothetical protein
VNIRIQVGPNTLDAGGDFEIDEQFLDLVRAFFDSISEEAAAADAEISKLNASQDALASAVAAATPSQ